MRINLRRPHILVSEKFLHGSYVIMISQQMRSETVSESMAVSMFVYLRFIQRLFDSFLYRRLRCVMPSRFSIFGASAKGADGKRIAISIRSAFGYLRLKAYGSHTSPKPRFKSSSWIYFTFFSCFSSGSDINSGKMVARSFAPLPSRTVN